MDDNGEPIPLDQRAEVIARTTGASAGIIGAVGHPDGELSWREMGATLLERAHTERFVVATSQHEADDRRVHCAVRAARLAGPSREGATPPPHHKPDHGKRPRIHHDGRPGGLHPREVAAEEFRLGMPRSQRRHHAGSVEVTRSLPRRDQHAHRTSLV